MEPQKLTQQKNRILKYTSQRSHQLFGLRSDGEREERCQTSGKNAQADV